MSPSRSRRGSQFPLGGVAVAVLLLVAVAGAAWYWLRSSDDPSAEGGRPALEDPALSPDTPATELSDLPELDASDEFVRRLVAGLSAHPQLARWLATDDLVRRFVGMVVDVAGNSNPSAHVRHLAPQEPFTAVPRGERTVISPESQRRFDLLAATYASLDTSGTARLYQDLRPLVDEAWRELGIPGTTFDDVLAMAVQNVLAAPAPAEAPEVIGADGVFVLADPELEASRGLEKAFLRMGPDNTRRIQAKTRELAAAMGVPPG